MHNLELLRCRHEVYDYIVEILLSRFALDDFKAGYRDDQPRGSDGRWIIGGGNYVVLQRHTTGNHQIDGITEKITDALDEVLSSVGPGYGSSYGTLVHTRTAHILREMNIPGIGQDGIEQNFSFGDLVRYGLSGSVRTDVILRNDQSGEILAIWDIKTSKGRLGPKRVADIRQNLNISEDIPVIEFQVNLGVYVKDIAIKSIVSVHCKNI